MITQLSSSVKSSPSDLYSLTLENNCGIIILDVDESKFTSEMQNQLEGLVFSFYLNDGTSEPKKLRNFSYIWRCGEDVAIPMESAPENCYVQIIPMLNESYLMSKNKVPFDSFPIGVSISDENIINGWKGAGKHVIDSLDSTATKDALSANMGRVLDNKIKALEDLSVYVFKGSASVSELNSLQNPENGWVYNVTDAGTLTIGNLKVFAGDNVAWAEDNQGNGFWDKFTQFIDLSGYYTKTEVDNLLSDKENKSNKVTTISKDSTDEEYPSAKCMWDVVGDVESVLNSLRGRSNNR